MNASTAVAVLAGVLASVSCAKGPSAASGGAATASRAPLTELREACVPTGPERCWNARDDNCNGIMDEGCGVSTGLVQFMIAWDAPTADVDLLVTDPKG